MAEEEAAGSGMSGLFKKKIGGIPVPVLLGLGVLIYIYLKKKQSGSTSSTAASQTDPAGNVGLIDPSTGYVYGSAEDTAALAANNNGSGATTSSSSNSTTAGQYATNEDWSRAAINYLVGAGIDPTTANAAITQYISSQTLTSEQQADVNLAIQAIGAPPSPPQPGGSPTPIVTPPTGGTTYASNPPSGLAVSSKTANTIAVKWNNVSNAQAYTVTYQTGSNASQTQTVSSTAGSATLTGLTPNSLYTIGVQATPAKPGDPAASITATTAGATIQGGNPPSNPISKPVPVSTPVAKPAAGNPATHTYVVVHGDTLSGIAAKNHTTLAEIKSLNPVYWTNAKYKSGNEIWAGDKVTLPGA